MKIKTAVDEYKYLVSDLIRLVKYEPFSEKFEDSYKELGKVLLTNIPEKKEDLLILFLIV